VKAKALSKWDQRIGMIDLTTNLGRPIEEISKIVEDFEPPTSTGELLEQYPSPPQDPALMRLICEEGFSKKDWPSVPHTLKTPSANFFAEMLETTSHHADFDIFMDKDQLDYGSDGETTSMFDYDKAYVTTSINDWIHTNSPIQHPQNSRTHVRVERHREIAAQVVSGAIMYMAEFVPSAAPSGPKLKDSIIDGCALRCVNLHVCLKSTCPCKAKQGSAFNVEWILNSGASAHFTPYLSDFTTINKKNFGNVQMVGKNAHLAIKGKGTVLIQHEIHDSRTGTRKMSITSLEPVFYILGMNNRLMSSGQLLQTGLQSKSD
jgi:hypothetical protein